jgi:OOP family OmpA-OmpF porin
MSRREDSPPPSAANDENSALSTLKALLLGPEQASIERIEHELKSPEAQTERVADSLPGSLHRAFRETPAELAQALDQPVAQCIKSSVQRDPGFFADVLYPVMGPAIRRSITQALRGLVQQINQSLEHSLTLKGLKWRLEAARSGVPFAEVVLRHTLRYRVDEVFLIQSRSGLLIQHLSQDRQGVRDADAVSAMLTAIRDFAHDTLDRDGERGSRLETVDVGDHTLWLIHGPRAYLACAIRGVPPEHLREELTEVVEELHSSHDGLLQAFDGDPSQAAVLRPLLEPCLRTEIAERQRRGGFPWPFALLSLLLIALLAWWGYGQWQDANAQRQQRAQQLAAVERLSAEPGTIVTDWEERDGRLLISGLHDPLATPASEVLARHGMQAGDYRLNLRPFQSAEPATALARAIQRLQPPATVTLSLDAAGTLSATGSASQQWRERSALLATTVPGVEAFDTGGLLDLDEDLRQRLITRLAPPPGVTLTVDDAHVRLSGSAPMRWIRELPAGLRDVEGLRGSDSGGLRASESERVAELRALIEQLQVHFLTGTELDDGQRRRLADFAVLAAEVRTLADSLGQQPTLQVIGRTDGTGTAEQNRLIAEQRAETVAQILQATSADLPPIETGAITQTTPDLEPDWALRRVEFRLLGMPPVSASGESAP